MRTEEYSYRVLLARRLPAMKASESHGARACASLCAGTRARTAVWRLVGVELECSCGHVRFCACAVRASVHLWRALCKPTAHLTAAALAPLSASV